MTFNEIKRNVVVIGLYDYENNLIAEEIFKGNNTTLVPTNDDAGSGIISHYKPKKCIMCTEAADYKVSVIVAPEIKCDFKARVDQIKKIIDYYFPDGIHLVIFVIHYGRLGKDDRNAIGQFFQYTDSDICNASAVVFSRCSLYPNAWEDYKNNFVEEVEWASKIRQGYHCVDFPFLDFLTEEAKVTAFTRIADSRNKLQELIRNAKSPHSITSRDSESGGHSGRRKGCCCVLEVIACVLAVLICIYRWCKKN